MDMSSKTIIKRYLIGFALYVFVGIMLFLLLKDSFIDFFMNMFFTKGKIVNGNVHMIEGQLEVVKLLKFIVVLMILVYSISFFDIVRGFRTYNEKQEKAKLLEIQNRIVSLLNQDPVTEEVEYLELDNILKTHMYQQILLEEKFSEKMMNLNQSMAFLAHDLRTPLTSIIGYSDLLLREKELSCSTRCKYSEIVLAKSYELESLIDQFFVYSKAQLQLEHLNKIDFNLFEFFEQIKETFYPYTLENGIEIKTSIPEEAMIHADPDALARCFNNLLKNAVTYSKANGFIKIHYEEQDGKHVFYLENQLHEGANLKESELFQPFYRGDYSRKKESKGAGLGLNIVKSIVEKHGGTITATVHNESIYFKISLPMCF